jgi:formyltetrahydrofolate-dependent phosphoribosylglycinamide formyltransferase
MSLKLAILVSGRGSNMTAILQAIAEGRLDAEVKLVFSNNADAVALETAANYGVSTAAVSNKGLNRLDHEERLLSLLLPLGVDFIVLAGYMRILSPHFLSHFRHPDGYFKVINIHPSLLPAFPGAHGYDDAFNYGVRVSGITVHLVDERVDHGPILAQMAFGRLADDSLESFKARGLKLEHKLFPEVLQNIARYGVQFFNRIDAAELAGTGKSNA